MESNIISCDFNCRDIELENPSVCCHSCPKLKECPNVCKNTECEIFKIDDYISDFVDEVREICNDNTIELEIYKYAGLKYYIFKLSKGTSCVSVGFSKFSLDYISKDTLKKTINEKIKELYDSITSQT